MRNNPYFRSLSFVGAFLVISMAICVANIVKLNIFAMILSLLLIVSMCVVIGYIYANFERWQDSNKPSKTEKTDTESIKNSEDFNKL